LISYPNGVRAKEAFLVASSTALEIKESSSSLTLELKGWNVTDEISSIPFCTAMSIIFPDS